MEKENTFDLQLFGSVSNPYTFAMNGNYNVNSDIVESKEVIIHLLTDEYVKENASSAINTSEDFYDIDIINLITDIPYDVIKIGYDTSKLFEHSGITLSGNASLSVSNTLVPPDTVDIFNEFNVSTIKTNEKIVLVKPKMISTSTLFNITTPIIINSGIPSYISYVDFYIKYSYDISKMEPELTITI